MHRAHANTIQLENGSWLEASETISLSELSRTCAISDGELMELVDYGALKPLGAPSGARVFSAACVATLRTACRIRREYDLELFTVALLMRYLNRIDELERELRTMQAQSPSHATTARREGPPTWHESHATARNEP